MGPETGTTKSSCTQGVRITTVRQGVDRIVLEFGFVLFVTKIFVAVDPATEGEAQSNDLQYYRDFQQHPVTAGKPPDAFLSRCLLVCTENFVRRFSRGALAGHFRH